MHLPTLIIGNRNYSSWSLRPWLFLRKNGIEFHEQQLWLDEPSFKTTIGHYNSGGKVPVLADGEVTVWDSLAIIEYAIEHFSCTLGWPQNPVHRAHARSSVCEMHSSFTSLRNECPMDIRAQHKKELSESTQADIQRICQIWDQALKMSASHGCWLYGDFSVADAMFAPVVFRFASYGVQLDPLLRAYLDYVLADPVLGEWAHDARHENHELVYP